MSQSITFWDSYYGCIMFMSIAMVIMCVSTYDYLAAKATIFGVIVSNVIILLLASYNYEFKLKLNLVDLDNTFIWVYLFTMITTYTFTIPVVNTYYIIKYEDRP